MQTIEENTSHSSTAGSGKNKKLQQIAERLTQLPEDKKAAFRKALEEKGINPWKLPIVSIASEGEGYYPLSFAQQRLWFIEQIEQGNTLYNLAFGLRFEGQLNTEAVTSSINEIVRRHSVLRTVFSSNESGEGRQQIKAFEQITLNKVSLKSQDDAEKALAEIAQQEAATPFDLTQDLMFRFTLVECGCVESDSVENNSVENYKVESDKTKQNEDTTIGLFTIHHIAFDFLSVELLVREFCTLYAYYCGDQQGDVSELISPLPIQYADFARWQREWQQSPDYQRQQAYWLNQLKGAPENLSLPTDFPTPKKRQFLGQKSTLSLSAELSDQLRELAKEQGVTLYMPLIALFNLLLSRYSQQDDICIGTSIANRSKPEVQNLLGFFVNLLVMRNQIDESTTFINFLKEVNRTATEAYAHQDLPFDRLVDLLGVERSESTPLFQVLFVLTINENSHNQTGVMQLPGVKVSAFVQDQEVARYPLTLRVNDAGSGQPLLCEMEYDVDLFARDTIDNMLVHYQQLVSCAITQPQAALQEFALLSEEQQQQWQDLANQSNEESSVNSTQTATELFELSVAEHSEASALVYEDKHDNCTYNYSELNQQANQLAHYLREQGVTRESRVALLLERSASAVIGILAVLKAGGTYVPLDTQWPSQRIENILSDSEPVCVLSESTQVAETTLPDNVPVVLLDQDTAPWATQAKHNPEVNSEPSDGAYIIYTSGSTGTPKGVVVEHRQLVNYIHGVADRFTGEGIDFTAQSFAHLSTLAADLGNTSLYGALCFGGCLHMISAERAFDPDGVATYMAEQQIDVVKIVPSHLKGLLAASEAKDVLPKSLLILGGEACSSNLLEQIKTLSPELSIVNHYGPSETTVGVLTHTLSDDDVNRVRIPLGRPLPNVQAYVLDAGGHLCPQGVAGELCIGGATVARGYLNRPELNEERFIKNPFVKGERLYRTGDRVRLLASGEFDFLGRVDAQVKIRGYRVELGDIESGLRQQDEIADAVVRVKRGDGSVSAEGADQLVAFIVLSNEQSELLTDLSERLAAFLPDYMMPQRIEVLEAIPLTVNGKIDTQALDALAQTVAEPVVEYRAPSNDKETQLLSIWQAVLCRENIGIDEDFFEIGGDSILGLQIIARAKKAGLKLNPRELFDRPTIARLAEVAKTISKAKPAQSGISNEVKAEVKGKVLLTPIQQWFFAADHPDKHHWNQAMIFQVKQTLDSKLLKQAVQALVKHHDALRVQFHFENQQWQQRYAAIDQLDADALYQEFDLEKLGLNSDANTEQVSAAIEATAETVQRSLNLQDGPLLRLVHFSLDGLEEENDRLLIVIHHLVVDGVSWRLLLNDLHQLYQQLLLQQPVELGSKSASYQQWAERLSAYAQSPELNRELGYWREQLASTSFALVAPALETDIAENMAENTVSTQKTLTLPLSQEQTAALLQDVPAVYGTQINDVLLAALTQAFCQPGDSLLVELEGHGREPITLNGKEALDLSQTVGWFTSRFPVCLQQQENNIGALLQATKQSLRAVPNKGIGYGVLRYLHADTAVRDELAAHATPWVSFNYLGQFDSAVEVDVDQLFQGTSESAGRTRAPDSKRNHVLDVLGEVSQGCLRMTWQYSSALYSEEWIEAQAKRYQQILLDIIAHCLEKKADMPSVNSDNDLPAQVQCLRAAQTATDTSPLFCLHHRGGHTLEYRAIAAALDPNIAVYGIQSKALSDPTYQESDIQVVAKEYAAMIRKVQPEGPYRLLGWSLGGVMAMAITRILEEQGQRVSFVGLIDAIKRDRSAQVRSNYSDDSLINNLLFVFGRLGLARYQKIDASLRQSFEAALQDKDEDQALDFACHWMVEQQLVDENLFDADYLRLRYRTTLQSRRLIDSFEAKPIKAKPYLWWAEESLMNNKQAPTAWENHCDGVAGSAVFEGGHFEIIQDPELHKTIAELVK